MATYKTFGAIEYLRNLLEYDSSLDVYLKFQNGGSGAWQLRQGFSMKTPIIDTPFGLMYLEYTTKFSEALFPSRLQASYRVNSVCWMAPRFTVARFLRQLGQGVK